MPITPLHDRNTLELLFIRATPACSEDDCRAAATSDWHGIHEELLPLKDSEISHRFPQRVLRSKFVQGMTAVRVGSRDSVLGS
jgi:hypothetical protein